MTVSHTQSRMWCLICNTSFIYVCVYAKTSSTFDRADHRPVNKSVFDMLAIQQEQDILIIMCVCRIYLVAYVVLVVEHRQNANKKQTNKTKAAALPQTLKQAYIGAPPKQFDYDSVGAIVMLIKANTHTHQHMLQNASITFNITI